MHEVIVGEDHFQIMSVPSDSLEGSPGKLVAKIRFGDLTSWLAFTFPDLKTLLEMLPCLMKLWRWLRLSCLPTSLGGKALLSSLDKQF